MSDYTQQLEEQNEQLKQKLAEVEGRSYYWVHTDIDSTFGKIIQIMYVGPRHIFGFISKENDKYVPNIVSEHVNIVSDCLTIADAKMCIQYKFARHLVSEEEFRKHLVCVEERTPDF